MMDLMIIVFVILAILTVGAIAYNDTLIEMEDNVIEWIRSKTKFRVMCECGNNKWYEFCKCRSYKEAKKIQGYFDDMKTKIRFNWRH